MNCPACGLELREDARFCDGCGLRVAEREQRYASSVEPGVAETFGNGRYRRVRLIGEGAKRWVYLARDKTLERNVALSVLKTGGLDSDALAQVERETQAMIRLRDHPRIVSVSDAGNDGGEVYVVARYMPKGDLHAYLRERPERRLPIAETLRIGEHVLCALEHAHRHGVIHRNLEPGNVYLDADGGAALGGFGLSRVGDTSLEATDGMLGAVSYMAPEQALGRPHESRSDLYSFGAVLYELLTGVPPFLGGDAVEVITHHLQTPPPLLSERAPGTPPALVALVRRLLAKDPEERPAAAREVLAELRGVIHALEHGPPPTPSAHADAAAAQAGGVVVGREKEVAQLREALDKAFSGQPRLLLLSGEPGIGKTRLAELVASLAELRGAAVLWGRCDPTGETPTYWPWTQILRDQSERLGTAGLHEDLGSGADPVSRLLPQSKERQTDVGTPNDADAGQARFRLFDDVTRSLRNASLRRPLVLIFEDLHWADAASLLLLQFFIRELGPARLLVLCSYRDEELDRQHPLSKTLAELVRSPASIQLPLRGVGAGDVARFIEMTSGVKPTKRLASAVYSHTEGNPFFMTEVVRLLVGQVGARNLQNARAEAISVPQSVRDVIGQRFGQLGATCEAVLATAAVLGREFDLDLLEAPCGLGTNAVLDAIGQAVAARLVAPVPEAVGRYRFLHALIREALYDEVGSVNRARLHAELGLALEERSADRGDESLPALAHHFFQGMSAGADPAKALDYTLRTAASATRGLAYETAAEQYQRAERILEETRPDAKERRCHLLLALGDVYWKSGEMAQARDAFMRAATLARALGLPEPLGEAAVGYGGTGYSGVWETTGLVDATLVGLLEEALDALSEEDSALRARLLGRLGIALYWADSPDRRAALTRDAVDMARRLGDPNVEAHALSARHLATWDPQNTEERLTGSREMISLAHDAVNSALGELGRMWNITALLERGEIGDADEEISAYTAIAEELREPQYLWRASMLAAMRAFMRGELDRAEPLIHQALTRSEPTGDPNAFQAFALQLGMLRREQGRIAEMHSALEAMVVQFPGVPSWRTALGIYYSGVGRHEDARAELDVLVANDFEDVPKDYLWLGALSGAAELCYLVSAREPARLLYDLLLPYGDRNIMVGDAVAALGAGAWFLGMLATTLDRRADAEGHFEHAIALNESMGLPLYKGRAELGLAELMLEDRSRARGHEALALLNGVLESAGHHGSRLLVGRAVDLKLRAQGIDACAEPALDFVAARVQATRPGLGEHASPEGGVTLLFTDIEGFTPMTERLGDREAFKIIQDHNAIVRERLQQHGGLELEMQGDAFVLAFSTPQRALSCASEIQRDLDAYASENPDEPIRVRMGLHTGEALRDAEGFFGKTLIVASRIAAMARGGEILVSSLVEEAVDGDERFPFVEPRGVDLKGLAGRYTLFLVDWASSPAR
jgi:class 3 adenylate cyclase/DNA polymerase III delta prime subunit